jgi:hypothetical protein
MTCEGRLCEDGAVKRAVVLLISALTAHAEESIQDLAAKHRDRFAPLIGRFLGAPFERPVPLLVKDPEFFRELARKATRDRAQGDRPHQLRDVLLKLRLITQAYDATAEAMKRYGTYRGIYIWESKTIFISDKVEGHGTWFLKYTLGETVAHELVHAHRHLHGRYKGLGGKSVNRDEAFAHRCLVEGDATLLMAAVSLSSENSITPEDAMDRVVHTAVDIRSPDRFESRGEYSAALLAYATTPYLEGAALAARIYEQGRKRALQEAFDRPPRSTEQVLHPEKYLGPEVDEPSAFRGGDILEVLGSNWKTVDTGVFGELDFRVVFHDTLGAERARRVAEGWDGCLYYLYAQERRPALLTMITAWDSEADAVEFANAWCEWAGRRDGREFDVHTRVIGAGEMRIVRTRDGLVITARRGSDVAVADGIPSGNGREILSTIWNTARRVREPKSGE